jgi:hypothetical protein
MHVIINIIIFVLVLDFNIMRNMIIYIIIFLWLFITMVDLLDKWVDLQLYLAVWLNDGWLTNWKLRSIQWRSGWPNIRLTCQLMVGWNQDD